MPVGILALQGDFEAHGAALARIGIDARPVADQQMDALRRKYSGIQKPTFAEQTAERDESLRIADQRMACMQKAEKAP